MVCDFGGVCSIVGLAGGVERWPRGLGPEAARQEGREGVAAALGGSLLGGSTGGAREAHGKRSLVTSHSCLWPLVAFDIKFADIKTGGTVVFAAVGGTGHCADGRGNGCIRYVTELIFKIDIFVFRLERSALALSMMRRPLST